MAQLLRQDAHHLSARDPVRLVVVLNGFGGAAVILAILFLGGSFYVENEIGRAFSLGAFFSGLLGGIVLFGFAKIIDMLDAIRQQTLVARGEQTPESSAGSSQPSQ
ncbi:MAG: hypothetical protein BMS9Abin01_1125 [Gammaproteobacteria bacterium]|nr:MAG: hypothetical protein BMS9Abin01_1125 [Gammaproteobacteria bacterium]